MMCTNAWMYSLFRQLQYEPWKHDKYPGVAGEIRVMYVCFETMASHVAIDYKLIIIGIDFSNLLKFGWPELKKKLRKCPYFYHAIFGPEKPATEVDGAMQVLLRPPEAWAEGFDPFGEEQKKQVTQLGPGWIWGINVNLVGQERNVAHFFV